MSEKMTVELFKKMLERLPGAISLARANPANGAVELLYINPKGPSVYGVSEEELHADPYAVHHRMTPEGRAAFVERSARAFETLEPFHWVGQMRQESGEMRWIEFHSFLEREPEGTLLVGSQAVDVTERKQAEEALIASERERRASDALHRAVIDALPVGVGVMLQDGSFPIVNAAQQRLMGAYDEEAEQLRGQAVSEHFGLFLLDGVTPLPMEDSPMVRVLAGETSASDLEYIARNPKQKAERRILAQVRPIHDDAGKIVAAVGVNSDMTAQRALEKELVLRNEQLAASEEAKTELIERLRLAIDELSNPILEVWDDVLAMPIIGLVDSRRTADMVRRLLAEVARTQATFVIIDLTGVEIVDTMTADHLIKLMRKVEIVGARCVLTGVRPAVAETLVDIGVDFGRLPTLRNLKHGLREALRHARREREGLRDLFVNDEPAAKPGPQNGT